MKKISILATALITVFAVIASSMTTYIISSESFNTKLYERDKAYNEKLSKSEAEYEKMMAVLEAQMEEYGEIAADICEIDRLYRENFPGELNADKLREYAIAGYIAGTGDMYGYYYTAEAAEALKNDLYGETDGIGVSVIYDTTTGSIEIIEVLPGTPAEEKGVLAGDFVGYIINDDGTREAVAEIGYEAALAKLKGEAGTMASFVVFRDNGKGGYDEIEFSIEREHIESVSVSYHVYEPDNSIGVIRISQFDGKTPEQFYDAVDALRADGVEKLIFDLRYNPGGTDTSVCDILDYILPEGPLIRLLYSSGECVTKYTSDARFLDMPMAVVVNSNTASAAELFASSIQDYGVGKIVGTQTYGKGSIQTLLDVFGDGSIVKFTSALYCPPYSDNFNGVGVTPDVTEEIDEALKDKSFYKYTDAEDNQLRAAAATFE